MNQDKTGKFIKSLREEKGLTQKDLAKKIGWSRSVISHLELGENYLSYDKAQALAKFFDITEDELYNGKRLEKPIKQPEYISKSLLLLNSKLRKSIILIISLICLLFLLLFSFYFVYYHNSIQMYSLSTENEKYSIDNGFLFISKEKMYLSLNLGNINSKNLNSVVLRYKTSDSDDLIMKGDSPNFTLVDFYKYNAYLDYNSIKNDKGDFYLEIETDEGTDIVEIKLTKEYANNKLFVFKDKSIVESNSNIETPVNVPNKIFELFSKDSNDNYIYQYDNKNIKYNLSYDADSMILVVNESGKDWNKSFIYYCDIYELVYTYNINDDVKEEYDFNINMMNAKEAKVYEYFNENYVSKYLEQ